MTTFMRRYELARECRQMPGADGFAPIRNAVNEIAGKVIRNGTHESAPIPAIADDASQAQITLAGGGFMGPASTVYLEFRNGEYSGAVNNNYILGDLPRISSMEDSVTFDTADQLLDWLAKKLAFYEIGDPQAPELA